MSAAVETSGGPNAIQCGSKRHSSPLVNPRRPTRTPNPGSAGKRSFVRRSFTNSTAWSFTTGRKRFLPAGNYNVLFIAIDDLKANFGAFITPELAEQMPKPITPHLDSLAAGGMSFTRAYCQQAVCWASRTSLLTGSRPDTTKIWDAMTPAQQQDFQAKADKVYRYLNFDRIPTFVDAASKVRALPVLQ